MKEEKTNLLKKIRDEVLNLDKSPLYKYRIKNNYFPVIGEGSHKARVMFIGEAPGEQEAKTGRPFCGAAGKILDGLLQSVNIKRRDVYITNIIKDRPPGNRDPLPEEINLYSPYLLRQIKIIKPKIIATLGRFSTRFILEKFGLKDELKSISRIHGKVFDAKASYGPVKIIPLYHPAVVLYNANSKGILLKDFKKLKKLISQDK